MGRGVGRVTVWNTAGTVAGAFLGGFVLVPRLGLRATLMFAAAATAVGGALALRGPRPATRPPRRPAAAAARARGGSARARPGRAELLATRRRLLRRRTTAPRDGAPRRGADDSSCSSTRTASRRRSRWTAQDGQRFYRSNGKTDASTAPGDMAIQLLLGQIADAPPSRPEGRLRPGPRNRRLGGRRRAVSRAVDRHRGHRGRGARRDALLRERRTATSSPTRASALHRRRRPQRAARAPQDLRRHRLGSLGHLGRRRRQPLHAGVLRARALAAQARRRDGPVVAHARAARPST